MVQRIGLVEALCGFQITITHLDGRQLLVKYPPGKVIEPGKKSLFLVICNASYNPEHTTGCWQYNVLVMLQQGGASCPVNEKIRGANTYCYKVYISTEIDNSDFFVLHI